MDLYRQNGGKPWKLSSLREILAAEIRVRQMSMQSVGNSQDNGDSGKKSTTSQQKGKPKHATASALVHDSGKLKECVFCEGSHYSDQCRTHPDFDSRAALLKGKCFSCLEAGHGSKECQNLKKCYYCKRKGHHQSLCKSKFQSKGSKKPSPSNNMNVDAPTFEPTNEALSHGESTYLSTALVDIRDPAKGSNVVNGRCFLDSGGSRTFVTTEMCKKLSAKVIRKALLAIAGFRDSKRKNGKYPVVELELMFPDKTSMVIQANVVDQITCPVQILPIDVERFPCVRLLPLAEPLVEKPQLFPIDILIGNDYYYDIVGTEKISLDSGLKLISSRCGFITAGRVESKTVGAAGAGSVMLLNGIPGQTSETFEVERFWTLEDIGIKDNNDCPDDEMALKKFNDTVRKIDGRYEVTWPWRSPEPELPDNHHLAMGRLKSLIRRIGSDKALLKQYDDTIADQKTKGVIEEAPAVPDGTLLHYIPHHCVLTPGKATTKLRIVYDASAKATQSNISLNEALYRGPVMLSDLCGLLIRFRLDPIGTLSDIEKAFLQVGLQVPERDVTRFIWLRDIAKPPVGDNIIVYRFCRVPFGFKSSSFLLGATVDHHLGQAGTPVATQIRKNLYVDNVVCGQPDLKTAVSYYKEAKELFNDAGMNLREWSSNSTELMEQIDPKDRGKSEAPKVLGMVWDLKTDSLSCSVGETDATAVRTKRQMLQAIAKIFDPCGLFSPVSITGKILMQELWLEQYDWDSVVDSEILERWKKFYESFCRIPNCPIDRLVVPVSEPSGAQELHCFCDASAKAYAAVIYLRCNTSSSVYVRLLFSKSRVAPVKPTTIPRLELMAVIVGTRLLKFVEAEMHVSHPLKKYVWSDSKCVLAWIQSSKVTTTFVTNRVREIKTIDAEFRYVETALNPADLPTRGMELNSLQTTDLWWHGPLFLKDDQTQWPKPVLTRELPIQDCNGQSTCLAQSCRPMASLALPALFDITKYSKLSRVLRITGWIKRFIHNARTKQRQRGPLKSEELHDALAYWIKLHQSKNFSSILTSSNDAKTRQLNQQLNLEIDNFGIIRSRGRLEYADIPETARFPILIAADDDFTSLLIRKFHESVLHNGIPQTLAAVRQEYWIIRGRQQVRKILNTCQWCRKVMGGSYRVPEFSSLPSFRVSQCRPFQYTGIDYVGPFFVSDSNGQRKVWICLFTCATVRAIHLEVVNDLSSEGFLLCLRRFVSLRGRPSMIISDNGTQFKSSEKLLRKLLQESSEIMDYCSGEGISWKFIPEMSPWMGAFYERMIASVKIGLKKSLWKRHVSTVELQTVACEVAAVINSRPLTYVSNDCGELPLTPAHFLSGGSTITTPAQILSGTSFLTSDEQEYLPRQTPSMLVNLWKRLENIVQTFWQVWRQQYLLSLRGVSQQTRQRNSSELKPEMDSVVLVKDELPRCRWKLGRICGLNYSKDNMCRSVQLRLASGKTITRPVKLLFPLESGSKATETLPEQPSGSATGTQPGRKAKDIAKRKLKEVFEDEDSTAESD